MLYVVEFAVQTRIVVFLRADDDAVLCGVDLDTGTRELVEHTCGEVTPNISVERAHLEHLVFIQILQHCAVEEDGGRVHGDALKVGEGGTGRAPRRGGKCAAARGELVDGAQIFF